MLSTTLRAVASRRTASAARLSLPAMRPYARQLSTTPRRHADMPERDEFMRQVSQTGAFKQIIEKNPGAGVAIADLYDVLRDAGIEFKPKQLPSKLQMMKLAMNRKFIAAFKKCVVELEKAGVDLKSADIMEKLMTNLHLEHEAHTRTDEALKKQAESKKIGGK